MSHPETPANNNRANQNEAKWEEWLDLLLQFQNEHGHLSPRENQVYRKQNLGKWVSNQRLYYNRRKNPHLKGHKCITDARIQRLNEIGFFWIAPSRKRKPSSSSTTALAPPSSSSRGKRQIQHRDEDAGFGRDEMASTGRKKRRVAVSQTVRACRRGDNVATQYEDEEEVDDDDQESEVYSSEDEDDDDEDDEGENNNNNNSNNKRDEYEESKQFDMKDSANHKLASLPEKKESRKDWRKMAERLKNRFEEREKLICESGFDREDHDERNKSLDCNPVRVKRRRSGTYGWDLEVEFSVEPIQHLFVCSLCNGLFREPHTITKTCLHTFCKSCLVLHMAMQQQRTQHHKLLLTYSMSSSSSNHLGNDVDNHTRTNNSIKGFHCPQCGDYLGMDWKKHILPDSSLQHLIDKVIFRDIAAQDEENERVFYERRAASNVTLENGQPEQNQPAKMKIETATSAGNPAKTKGKIQGKRQSMQPSPQADGIGKTEHIRLVPANSSTIKDEWPSSSASSVSSLGNGIDTSQQLSEWPPALDKPCLQVPGNMSMAQLKKYLNLKLPDWSAQDIFLEGKRLGNEWTVGFVKRAMWTPLSEKAILTLHYL